MVVSLAFGANTLLSNASRENKASRYSSWGPRQQDHGSMNVHILSNLHARQMRKMRRRHMIK
jgi:hypothetical protein